ncbi:MAG: cupin domain-containing protein [Gammaproteobacteria bacterium]|jgi:cupin 2 domain-containing protein|nr:cupin domain-containing protein [Gammaproteobacteria bacterium]
MHNLFESIPEGLTEELTEVLTGSGNVRIERIVSRGHASPEGFWYDQAQREFVLLLRGSAALEFEGREAPIEMGPGDFLVIDAHRRHRVTRTARDGDTVWLAVHFG